MREHSVVGKSVQRLDAVEKVTGAATYCTDVTLVGMLHARTVRSPYPHAKITSIDTSKAENLPGVRAVATGKDVHDRDGQIIKDQYFIAKDRVRFAGEIVAAVAATSLEIAEEAASLIEVEYEEMPAVFDVEEAILAQPPAILHPDLLKYDKRSPSPLRLAERGPNVFRHHKVRKGDVEKGFSEADVIVENRYSTTRIQHCQMEPHVSIAKVEADGGYTIWTGSQSIYAVRYFISESFGVPLSKVRVIAHYVGGAFGGKLGTWTEGIAALLARKSRRPVRLAFTRDEVFVDAATRIPMVVHIKDGVTNDGQLVARQIEVLAAGGAYADHAPLITRSTAFGASATYCASNFKLDAYGVYVNEPAGGPFRGFGSSQVAWAIEQQMDILARKIGMDPVELRRRNILKEGNRNVLGEVVHSIGVGECLEQVAKSIGWESGIKPALEGAWRKGKGVAIGNKFSKAPASAVAIVKVLEDGVIEVRTSADEVGQGVRTVMAQIAAEQFQVDIKQVRIVPGDTLVTPYDEGALSSRQTFNTGNAVRLACEDAKRQLFEIAAARLESSTEDLETAQGRVFVKGSPDRGINIPALFTPVAIFGTYLKVGGEILGKATWYSGNAPENPETGQSERVVSFYTHGAVAVEVGVNIETGEVKVERICGAFDSGRALNPSLVESQIEGGMGMGIGASLFEQMLFDEGRLTNANFMDYKMPSITEIPTTENVVSAITEAYHNEGPYEAKGVGEVTLVPTSPAIANAVFNAVGVRIKDLPITREKILAGLREPAEGSQSWDSD